MGTTGEQPGVWVATVQYRDLRLLRRRLWVLEDGWTVFVSPLDAIVYRSWCRIPGRAYRLPLCVGPADDQLACLGRGITGLTVKKPEGRKVAGIAGQVAEVDEWAIAYPLLFEHMTAVKWDDGTSRQTSSLTLFQQDGVVKAILKDKEAGLCLWVASPGVGTLFPVLEAALASSETEWRVDRHQGGESAKRVKRSLDRGK